MTRQHVTLRGTTIAAAYITNAEPLAGLAADAEFTLSARPASREDHARLKAAGTPFEERRPVYMVAYEGQDVGFASALEQPVRELLALGYTVELAAKRTQAAVKGYEGVQLLLPEAEPLSRWAALARAGVDVLLDAPTVEANLNVDEEHSELPAGQVTVTVGQLQDKVLPVTVTAADGQTDTWQLDARQHSRHIFEPLAGRTIAKACCAGQDSWTQMTKRYMKIFMAV